MAAGEAAVGPVEIRPLSTLEDWALTLRLQREVWGYDESDQVPSRLFGVFLRTGGSCLGAFLDGEMVGFALAFPGFKPTGENYWHSHMVGVRNGLHGRGIGYLLKLRQRQAAIEAGVERIEWTFDPLQSRNAHFNICKLGVEAPKYLPNFYGTTSSTLHGGMPTDRLVAVWRLRSARVRERLSGVPPPSPSGSLQIAIPSRIDEVPRRQALALQLRLRGEFQRAFARGLKVTAFVRGARTGAYYLGR